MYEELPLYQSFKKVRAAKIDGIDTHRSPKGGAVLILASPPVDLGQVKNSVAVDADYLVRCPKLAVGGYFVTYEDGYTSYSPAEAFESGYCLADESPAKLSEPVDYPNTIETVPERRRLTALHLAVSLVEKSTYAERPADASKVIDIANKFDAWLK